MADLSDTSPPDSAAPSEDTSSGSQTQGLQAALQAERKKRQEIEARLSSFEAEQRQRAEEDAKRRGEYEALYTEARSKLDTLTTELDSYKARETARLEALQSENRARLEALPESFRALVPEGLSPDAVRSHLGRLESVLSQATPSGGIPPRMGKAVQEKIPEAALREAERYGYSDARGYYDRVWKPRQERKGGK